MSRFRPAGFRKWADRMAARLATRWRAACTAAEHRISRGWTAWRRPHGTPLRLGTRSSMGGGRPAERRFTVGGSGKSVARCHRTVLAYWKFESISLQQTVSLSPDFDLHSRKSPGSRQFGDYAGAAGSAETRKAAQHRTEGW